MTAEIKNARRCALLAIVFKCLSLARVKIGLNIL